MLIFLLLFMSKSLFCKVHLPQDLELRYVYNLIPWEYVLSMWNVKNVSKETRSVNFFCRFPWRSYKWLITRLNEILERSFSVLISSRKRFLSPPELISYGICYGALNQSSGTRARSKRGKKFFASIKMSTVDFKSANHKFPPRQLRLTANVFCLYALPLFLGPAMSKVAWQYYANNSE